MKKVLMVLSGLLAVGVGYAQNQFASVSAQQELFAHKFLVATTVNSATTAATLASKATLIAKNITSRMG